MRKFCNILKPLSHEFRHIQMARFSINLQDLKQAASQQTSVSQKSDSIYRKKSQKKFDFSSKKDTLEYSSRDTKTKRYRQRVFSLANHTEIFRNINYEIDSLSLLAMFFTRIEYLERKKMTFNLAEPLENFSSEFVKLIRAISA